MPRYIHDEPFILDAAAAMFTVHKLGTLNQHATIAGAGDVPFGVLQETVVAADVGKRAVAVRTHGTSRCVASEAIAIGARVVSAANGQVRNALAATAKQNQLGIAKTAAGVANDQFDVELTPGVQIDT